MTDNQCATRVIVKLKEEPIDVKRVTVKFIEPPIDVNRAAELTGISESTILRWVKNGNIISKCVIPDRPFVILDEVIKFHLAMEKNPSGTLKKTNINALSEDTKSNCDFLNRPTIAANTEPLFTIKAAATQIGLPYWKLGRAVKRGLVPSHTLLNSKKLVRLSEVVAALQTTITQGDNHD